MWPDQTQAAGMACGLALRQTPPAMEFDDARRYEMVRTQLVGRDITDARVLAAMAQVPRLAFVPPRLAAHAYDDTPLDIGEGQTISQPYIVAKMTELAQVAPGDRVLEIGTGCGYQTAVLAACGAEVYSIEIVEGLARRAAATLRARGYGAPQVHLRIGDGHAGWPEAAPFAAIVVTAAPATVPTALTSQLADGGRLVIPIGDTDQRLVVIERLGDDFTRREVFPVRFVPMTGVPCEG